MNMSALATPPTIIQAPPETTTKDIVAASRTDIFQTTVNGTLMTTEASLLDGFDAITITGVIIGGLFMLVMILLPVCWLCSNSRERSRRRKESLSSGHLYSTSEQGRRKSSLAALYSESAYKSSESGYKSESDFKSETDFKSESQDFSCVNPAITSDTISNNMEYKVISEKSSPGSDGSHVDESSPTTTENVDSAEDKTEHVHKEHDEGICEDGGDDEDDRQEGEEEAGENTWL